ncbi:MAG TPA: nitrogen fixation protein NifH [Chloroflexia bacterium]|nr:nitrogen fixation protein NifH [Chloroflexia bacterium]
MSWQNQLRGDPLPWLLEDASPGVRYLAMRDLLALPQDDPTLTVARKLAHTEGPIATILATMDQEGYWVTPGPGYNPKYRASVWSLIMLAQLGASAAFDERIARACTYMLDHALTPGGQFSTSSTASGTADCLQGNLCWTLLELGYDDPRLELAFDWMARSVTGEGIASRENREAAVRYYAGKCGPLFACGANNGMSCAWGAVKVMLAFGKWPAVRRTPLIEAAIEQGVNFLFSTDPALADYPTGWNTKPSGNWWKFGFPVFYVTDLLQNVEALVALGYAGDSRLDHALSIIRGKQDEVGRWNLEYDYTGKTWVDLGPKKQPNKWVTLRALRVLKAAGESHPSEARTELSIV